MQNIFTNNEKPNAVRYTFKREPYTYFPTLYTYTLCPKTASS